MSDPERRAQRAAIRRFNRFVTGYAGALSEAYNGSPFTLPEARVLWELRHGASVSGRGRNAAPDTAAGIARRLAMDPSYLSRILRRFRAAGLVASARSRKDGRARALALTATGEIAMDRLEAVSNASADATLERLIPASRARLLRAMAEVEGLLAPAPSQAPVALRPPRAGDLAWVAHRHAVLYAAEYRWDQRFEAVVARICAEFIETFDPATHRGWIAEREGEVLGSVFLVPGEGKGRDRAAKLRLLYVEPAARGAQLGRLLVRECIREARAMGYARLDLWTHDVLRAARAIYASEGFEKISSTRGKGFGGGPTREEVWSLKLRAD